MLCLGCSAEINSNHLTCLVIFFEYSLSTNSTIRFYCHILWIFTHSISATSTSTIRLYCHILRIITQYNFNLNHSILLSYSLNIHSVILQPSYCIVLFFEYSLSILVYNIFRLMSSCINAIFSIQVLWE